MIGLYSVFLYVKWKIRHIFDTGIVEVDESYFGGRPRLKENWDLRKKEAVMGMVQRDGKVFLKHVSSTGKWELIDQVRNHISPKARIMTDEAGAYKSLKKYGYRHSSTNHSNLEYIKGVTHTQNIENVWTNVL